MEWLIFQPRAASDGRRHAEKRIVGIDRPKGADLLHVIGAAAHNCARRKEALQRLKPPEPIVAELFEQRVRVEIEPGWLDVENYADLGQVFDNLGGEKIRMRNAGTAVA